MTTTTDAEPWRSRWMRRAVTIPIMLGATAAALVTLPLTLPLAVVADLVRLRLRFPTVRVILFVVQYGINDSAEIFLAPLYWALAGFGTRLGSPASMQRHERLQAWSLRVLAHRAEHLLGLRVDIDADAAQLLAPGPVIVLCRHVSIMDTSLPGLLYQRIGFRTPGVIMAELLADPGFDLLYGRTGSVFIPRHNGPVARQQIAELSNRVDPLTAVVIFPEGQLFRPDRLQRSLARLAERDPARAEAMQGLRHVLPPRPGGVLALLDTVPAADVVVMAHAGLDDYPAFRDLARAVPLRRPVAVTAWRTAAADIPADPQPRTTWLDDQWRRVDAWVAQRSTGP